MRKAVLVLLVLLGAVPARAQDADDAVIVRERDLQLDATQQRELDTWTRDVEAYRRWSARYRNRVSRNIFGLVSDRRPVPEIPAWLPGKCDVLADFIPPPAGPVREACTLLAFFRSNFTVDPVAQQAAIAQKQNERDPHASFWKHVHLDAGWGSMDYRMSTYGLVGVHVTLPEIAKRVQIYVPPGVLLSSMPDGHGGRALQPAATVGVSIKMFSFQFPQNKEGTAFFNVAKAYVINRPSSMDMNGAVDLMGLSFSWGQ